MTMRLLPALLAAGLLACAAAPVGEMHAEADNAVSAKANAACAVRNAFLRDNASVFKPAAIDALPSEVADRLNAVNGGSVSYAALATFSVTDVGTVVIAQTTTGAASEDGAATTMTQFLSSKGTLLAVATSDGSKIAFATAIGGEALACSTEQPAGTGPELAASATGSTGATGEGTTSAENDGGTETGDVGDPSADDSSLAP